MIGDYRIDDLRDIEKATSYTDLLTVATRVLARMFVTNPEKHITMVCGPISTGGRGSRKENLAVFAGAIARLSRGGNYIFSQMPFENDMERIYKSDPALQGLRLLEEFYLPIFEMNFVKLICFLPGWENSIGAAWEHTQAKRFNIPIIYLSEYYTKD